MSETPTQQERSPAPQRGSRRQGTTIVAHGHELRFDIPTAWLKWYEENEERPNLHLTPAELNRVKNAEGEWDQEFATVLNAILPFDGCVAHVGAEGWGAQGISYADLQVRAYVLAASPHEIAERVREVGAATNVGIAGTFAALQQDQTGGWSRLLLKYPRVYDDYGATAIIDLRARQSNRQTVVFAFMYTNHTDHDAEIETILGSVVLKV